MRRLQYPTIPCLNVGTPRKVIFIPAEVCKVAAGQRRLKLDEHQTAEMIKTSAQVQQPDLPTSSMFPAAKRKSGKELADLSINFKACLQA